jgi:hypothetical protein
MANTNQFQIPLSEKIKGIPSLFGIRLAEEAPYKLLECDGHFDIRHYAPELWAQTTVEGSHAGGADITFQRLAEYFFGKNSSGRQIPMTIPVIEQVESVEAQEEKLTMSFVLPTELTVENIPLPLDEMVKIKKIPKRYVAALTYTGKTDAQKIAQKTIELQNWLSAHPQYQAIGKAESALYDGPNVVPFFRRNEILMEVALLN